MDSLVCSGDSLILDVASPRTHKPKIVNESLGRVLDPRLKGPGFETHRRHCVVSLSKNINPSLVLVQPRKTHPFITERLLMGRKESNKQTKASEYDQEMSQSHTVDQPRGRKLHSSARNYE